jgi:hypothetical protein
MKKNVDLIKDSLLYLTRIRMKLENGSRYISISIDVIHMKTIPNSRDD